MSTSTEEFCLSEHLICFANKPIDFQFRIITSNTKKDFFAHTKGAVRSKTFLYSIVRTCLSRC